MKAHTHSLFISALTIVLFCSQANCQNSEGVSIRPTASPPHPSAMLDVYSTSKGLLIPRCTLTNVTDNTSPILNPEPSLLVFNESSSSTNGLNGRGFYFWDQSKWNRLNTSPELWTKIGSTQNIQYYGGPVRVGGSTVSSPSSGYQLEVNGSNNNCALFVSNSHTLAFGANDVYNTGGGDFNWLTQIGRYNGVNYSFGCNYKHVYQHGETGLMIQSDGKTPGHVVNTSIYGGDNNNLILRSMQNFTTHATVDIQLIADNDVKFVSGSGKFEFFNNSNSTSMCFDATNWTACSDSSLKHNISDLKPALNRLRRCRPVTFNWKTGPSTGTNYGFIAQEIERIFPDLVSELEVPINEGADTDTPVTKKGVNYMAFITILVKALQEQQDEIDQLKSDMATLKVTASAGN